MSRKAAHRRRGEPARQPAAVSPQASATPSLLTQPLGLEGWTDREPVVLAALASEEPLLLIGRHGAAKSFLLERLAKALGLDYRFYNASLINFDDLVGIPVPDEQQQALRYIVTPTAIWGAEVVFIDEINRTRPELQNKLFPIIHERRVQGQQLEKLRYRWAAMNPPPPPDEAAEEEVYLGAEPLDPALADRFAFLIPVPSWQDLTEVEKRSVLEDQFRGEHPFAVHPGVLVAEARTLLDTFRQSPPRGLQDYLIALEKLLGQARLRLSARRVTILHRNILAIQAARLCLSRRIAPTASARAVDWNESALLALRYSLPHLTQTGSLDQVALLAAHRQAWAIADLDAHDPWRELLQITDPLERFIRARQFGAQVEDQDLGQLTLEAVAAQPTAAQRVAASLAAYLALHRDRSVPGTVVETLAREIQRVIQPHQRKELVHSSGISIHREVGQICATLQEEGDGAKAVRDRYTRNLLYGLLPDGFTNTTAVEVKIFFEGLWHRLFGASQPATPLSTP